MNQWTTGVLGSTAAVLGAAVIVYFASAGSALFAGWPVFALCALFAFLVQWVVFAHAWIKQTEAFYDLTGSITYVVMVLAALGLSGNFEPRALVLTGLIVIWALRLGPFLYKRIKQAGEDRRFRKIKVSFPLFFMTWTLQGTWVFITACCALAAITSSASVPLGLSFWLGLLLWCFGFGIEVIADRQKSAFRNDPNNTNRFISSGLWAWSRHPNYFGEIVLWLGIAIMSYPVLSGGSLVTLISPIFVVFLLTFISGVRMLENRANKQWGEDPDYQAYRDNTPVLVLWPPRNK